jgi:hypothetical protein
MGVQFLNHLADKGLASKKYKEFSHLNNKTQINQRWAKEEQKLKWAKKG